VPINGDRYATRDVRAKTAYTRLIEGRKVLLAVNAQRRTSQGREREKERERERARESRVREFGFADSTRKQLLLPRAGDGRAEFLNKEERKQLCCSFAW